VVFRDNKPPPAANKGKLLNTLKEFAEGVQFALCEPPIVAAVQRNDLTDGQQLVEEEIVVATGAAFAHSPAMRGVEGEL
jgi:hypothetical protein